MKNMYVLKGFLLLLFIGFTSGLQADPPSPFYNGDLTQLKKQARKTNTPYFIYFQLPDCESCKQMDELTWKDAQVSRYAAQNFLGYRVNAMTPAQGQKALADFGIFVYPALLIFDADGKLQKHVEGYIDATNLMKIFTGKPICTTAESTAKTGLAPVATQPGQTFSSHPVYDDKKTEATYRMPTTAATNATNRSLNLRTLPEVNTVPTHPSVAESTSQVKNEVYEKYDALHRQAVQRETQAAPAARTAPTAQPAHREATTSGTYPKPAQPAPFTPPPASTRGINLTTVPAQSAAAQPTNPSPLRTAPDLGSRSSARATVNPQKQAAAIAAATAIEDPRFRAYNPWQTLAPIAGINYSLVLDTYPDADQALKQIEAIRQYWPNSVWAYQEGENGAYRLALGNFRSEEQALQYAELLLRAQQLKSEVNDLFTLIYPPQQNAPKSR